MTCTRCGGNRFSTDAKGVYYFSLKKDRRKVVSFDYGMLVTETLPRLTCVDCGDIYENVDFKIPTSVKIGDVREGE